MRRNPGTNYLNKAIQRVQQSPDERLFNDLFVNWSGENFIFEFKRNVEKIPAELKKPQKTVLLEALNNNGYQQMASISARSHFLGVGLPSGLGFILPIRISL